MVDCLVDEQGNVKTNKVKRFYWFHTPRIYGAYDTYAKIIRTNTIGYGGGKR